MLLDDAFPKIDARTHPLLFGLLVDLGPPRSVGKVTLDLVGNGTDLQVLTSNDPGGDPQDYDLMAQATEAG